MGVDETDHNLAIKRLAEWPNEHVRQQHQKTDDEAADDKHVAENEVEWKEFCLYPAPHAAHCRYQLPPASCTHSTATDLRNWKGGDTQSLTVTLSLESVIH